MQRFITFSSSNTVQMYYVFKLHFQYVICKNMSVILHMEHNLPSILILKFYIDSSVKHCAIYRQPTVVDSHLFYSLVKSHHSIVGLIALLLSYAFALIRFSTRSYSFTIILCSFLLVRFV